MKTISLFALALTLGMGTASMLNTNNQNSNQPVQNADAAFRDGLYLGKLAAQAGAEPHVARGRWATPGDRVLFSAGYQEGYSGSLASRRTPTTRQAE
jgi:thiazole synthase ThiGH ThiG subunit